MRESKNHRIIQEQSQLVLVNLTQLVGTIHNIYANRVCDSNSGHDKKRAITV